MIRNLVAAGFLVDINLFLQRRIEMANVIETRIVEFVINPDWCQARGILAAVYDNVIAAVAGQQLDVDYR